MWNCKCFIYHKVECHSSKHTRYPRGGKSPQRSLQLSGCFQKTNEVTGDPKVATFMSKRGITPDQVLSLLGTPYGEEEAQEWPAKEESVAKISIKEDF